MNETITSAIAGLPDDLRPAAQVFWERSRTVTDNVTETLRLSFLILRHIPGDPQRLEAGVDMLMTDVISNLGAARADIDAAYPRLANSWSGQGAAAFLDYVPKLSQAIQSAEDSTAHTVEAVSAFHRSLKTLRAKVVAKTEQSCGEVITAVTAAGDFPVLAVAPVVSIVERFSIFVEELAESLMQLTNDAHRAGELLQKSLIGPAHSVNGSPQLPAPAPGSMSNGWTPTHAAVSLDTQAIAQMTTALDRSSTHWNVAAERCRDVANNHLTPEAFGLAGVHFYGEVQGIMSRDSELYDKADNQISDLAQSLRAIGASYTEADEAADSDLRRSLEDE